MLDAVIVVGGDGLPAVDARQRRDGVGAGALRRRVGIRQIVADAGDVAIRPETLELVVAGVGVHRVAVEHAVVLDAQLLGALVENEDDRERGQAQTAAVDHLDGLGGHGVRRLDHRGIDLVGVGGGNHVVRVDLVAARGAHAIRLAVLDQNLVDVLTVLDLHAHRLGALRHLERHLVGECSCAIK